MELASYEWNDTVEQLLGQTGHLQEEIPESVTVGSWSEKGYEEEAGKLALLETGNGGTVLGIFAAGNDNWPAFCYFAGNERGAAASADLSI